MNTITPITPITIKGGVVRVIDDATGDIARTTSGWIEDEKYRFYMSVAATAVSAEFDSAVTRTGKYTLKLSTTDITGKIVTGLYTGLGVTTATEAVIKKYGIPVKASTSYRLKCYVKTNNVAANAVYLDGASFTADGTVVSGSSFITNKLSGTEDWTLLTTTFTTPATAVYLSIRQLVNVAGNISDAWFDVNSMTLEEVSTITNSGSYPALFYPKCTAVTSTDNIDQSFGARDNSNAFGDGTLGHQKSAKGITPTKKNFSGVIVQRVNGAGTYTGDVIISLQADSGTSRPSNTPLKSVTIPNATWMGLTAGVDYAVMFDYVVTPGVKYYIVFDSTTQDAFNFTAYGAVAATGERYSYNGTSWGPAAGTNGGSIKTLYSKNTTNFTVRTDNQTLSVTAPTTDGWDDGDIIDTSDGTYGITPLTLEPGVNNIYYSSNGSSTADGEVDPSLQAIIGGGIHSFDSSENACRDENGVLTLIATDNIDPTKIAKLYADPTLHSVIVRDATEGTDAGGTIAHRDENYNTVILAVSSDDGVTPVAVYIRGITHELLIDSN